MSIRTLCSTALILLFGITATYTVDGHTYRNCEVKTIIGIPAEAAPKTIVTSCGMVFTAPHAKKGVLNWDNVADMNRAAEANDVVRMRTTGWPIPVAYSISAQ